MRGGVQYDEQHVAIKGEGAVHLPLLHPPGSATDDHVVSAEKTHVY